MDCLGEPDVITGVLIRRRQYIRERESNVVTGAGVILPLERECQQILEAGRSRRWIFFQRL